MKYLLLGLLSLPLVTACTAIQEEYYEPYGFPPPPRAEVYQNTYPGPYPRPQAPIYQRGPRYYLEEHVDAGSTVIVTPRGPAYNPANVHTHGQKIITPDTRLAPFKDRIRIPGVVHGHSQDTVQVPQNRHSHGEQAVQVPQNRHGHGEGAVQIPQNRHGHGEAAVQIPQNRHGHGEGAAQVPQNRHGHGEEPLPFPQNVHGHS